MCNFYIAVNTNSPPLLANLIPVVVNYARQLRRVIPPSGSHWLSIEIVAHTAVTAVVRCQGMTVQPLSSAAVQWSATQILAVLRLLSGLGESDWR